MRNVRVQNQLKTHNKHTLLQEKRCDFWKDCDDGSDEITCPIEYLFENCEESLCYWNEEPTDELDWVVAHGMWF